MSTAPSKESHSTALRTALWIVYGKRCAYTDAPINRPEEVAIDHVLPERLAKDDEERQRVLVTFGLPASFSIKGNLLNLVPTTPAFNTLKSDKTGRNQFISRFGAYTLHQPYKDRQNAWSKSAHELIAHGLALAAAHHEAVERERRKLECKEKGVRVFEPLPQELREATVAEFYDDMSGEEPEFPVCTELEKQSAYVSRSAMMLDCNLPTATEPRMSARLSCKSLKIRDASITFDHRDLLQGLFRGFGNGSGYGERPFIVGPHEDGVFVQLHHVRCWLPQSHLEQLCEIVDLVVPHCLGAYEQQERDQWRSLQFPNARRGFRLHTLPGRRWRLLLDYARAHDAWSGKSPEHIFDAKSASFHILERHENRAGGREVAQVHAEPAEVVSSNTCGDWVSVCWDPLPLVWPHQWDVVGPDPWDAEKVHAKVEQLLHSSWEWDMRRPSSGIARRVLNALWRRPTVPLPPTGSTSARSRGRWPRTLGFAFKTVDSMRDMLSLMHDYLHVPRPHNQVPGRAVMGAYLFVRHFVQQYRPGSETLAHVARTLPTGQGTPDYEEAMSEVEDFALHQRFVSSAVAADALAGILNLLESRHGLTVSDDVIETAVEHLDLLYKYVRPRVYLERLLSRPW